VQVAFFFFKNNIFFIITIKPFYNFDFKMILFKNKILLVLSMLLLLFSCSNNEFNLNSGDLLFQVNKSNDFTNAIVNTTGNNNNLSFSHVAIVLAEENKICVIEAVPNGGVHKILLQNFLDSSAHNSIGKPLVVVYRLTDTSNVFNIVINAKKYIGLPYDSAFIPSNNKYYCSELVYESFLNSKGEHIFNSNPMSFCDSTGKISLLWEKYFNKLNKPIPQGVLGTNPNDISKEKCIKEVFRFF